jgi:SRSO17 transposase
MIERAVAAQVPFAWITGDAVYGDNRSLRVWLEQQDLHFVLAVASNQYVWPDSTGQKTVAQLAATVQPQDWTRLSAGDGAKGPRWRIWWCCAAMKKKRHRQKKPETAEQAGLQAAAALIPLTVPEVRKLLWQWL